MEHKSPELLKAAPNNVLSKPVPLYPLRNLQGIRVTKAGNFGMIWFNCFHPSSHLQIRVHTSGRKKLFQIKGGCRNGVIG